MRGQRDEEQTWWVQSLIWSRFEWILLRVKNWMKKITIKRSTCAHVVLAFVLKFNHQVVRKSVASFPNALHLQSTIIHYEFTMSFRFCLEWWVSVRLFVQCAEFNRLTCRIIATICCIRMLIIRTTDCYTRAGTASTARWPMTAWCIIVSLIASLVKLLVSPTT